MLKLVVKVDYKYYINNVCPSLSKIKYDGTPILQTVVNIIVLYIYYVVLGEMGINKY